MNASEFTQVADGSSSVVQLPSNIITSTFVSGNSGNLTLVTKNLSVEGGGEILTSTFGTGKGGNLTVNTPGSTQVVGYLSGASQLSSSLDFGQKGKFAYNLREQKLRHHKFPQLFFKLSPTELNP